MEYRKDIQILRGVSVLMVVLFHLQIPFFEKGFLGVDAFFVISGFLMALLYDRGSFLDFYKRRIDRLLPAYFFTVLITLIVALLFVVPSDFIQLVKQASFSAIFSGNLYFWNQNSYFDKAAFNPLLNLWSLAVEVQFYLIVPVIFPFLRKNKWLMFALMFFSLLICITVQTISPKTAFFLTPFRLWEFLIGASIAWYFGKFQERSASTLVQYGLVATFLCAFFILPLEPEGRTIIFGHPSISALMITFLTALIIFCGLPEKLMNSVPGNGFSKLGDYSYSIYLVHFPIIVLWNYEPFGGTILQTDGMLGLVLVLGMVALFGYFSYEYIERKYSHVFYNRFARIGLVLTLLAFSYVSVSLNSIRYDSKERNIFAAWEDRSPYRCGKVFRILNPVAEICPLGETNNERKLLLVGNSHADSIKSSFGKIANMNGFSFYFVVQNSPLMNSKLTPEFLLEQILDLGIDYVAIHFNNNFYKEQVFVEQLASFMRQAKVQGIEIFLISPVPVYSVHIPKALYENSKEVFKFAYGFERHKANTKEFIQFTRQLESVDVHIYDPAEVLCFNSEKCLLSDEDMKPYYFDNGHLTLTGAAVLESMFDSAIKALKK